MEAITDNVVIRTGSAISVAVDPSSESHSAPHVTGRTIVYLILLTMAAILIHGYHVGVEDQEVYLAAIQKNLDPSAYPFNAAFFLEQMKIAVFVPCVAATARVLHSVEWALLLWHGLSIFGILLACWKIAAMIFQRKRARWAALWFVTVLLTIPIAGTALYPVDQYLCPRAPATCGILLALAACMRKRYLSAAVWLVFSAAMHPLMSLFGVSLVLFFAWPKRFPLHRGVVFTVFMLPLHLLRPVSPAWLEAAEARRYGFPLLWTWYEWLGLIAPILLVWWFARIAKQHGMQGLHRLATRLLGFAIFQFVVALLMTVPVVAAPLTSLQPMRWLHVFYFLFLLMAGGLLGHFVGQNRMWCLVMSFVLLAAVMFFAQRDLFEHSNHLELPGRSLQNPWANAFLWAKANTPTTAIFAIDPMYMSLPEEDGYGFRALAQRSLLAEESEDPGAAMVFPDLAPEWQRQVHSQRGLNTFRHEQFRALKDLYGVSWVVLAGSAKVEEHCPYRNAVVQVCSIE